MCIYYVIHDLQLTIFVPSHRKLPILPSRLGDFFSNQAVPSFCPIPCLHYRPSFVTFLRKIPKAYRNHAPFSTFSYKAAAN